MAPDRQSQSLTGKPLLAGVSQAILDLHSEPGASTSTTARSYLNDDMLSCVLRDVLSGAERLLIEGGRGTQVLFLRQSFEDAMAERVSATVERLSGRAVLAFLSQSCLAPDLTLETFFLEPSRAEPAQRSAASSSRRMSLGSSTKISATRSGSWWVLLMKAMTRRPVSRSMASR